MKSDDDTAAQMLRELLPILEKKLNSPLSNVYFKMLKSIDWHDELLVAGIREGLTKFLTNSHLAFFCSAHKYHSTHFVSQRALDQMQKNAYRELIWEHLIPKTEYIQQPCERLAKNGSLTVGYIENLLMKYWYTATVTRDEDSLLSPNRMPANWNRESPFARYHAAKVALLPNPYFDRLVRSLA
jgi:hypothetical protein